MRLPAEHTSPWLMNSPNSAPSTLASKSASANRMFGDFPPSSSEIFFSVSAAAAHDDLPDLGAAGERDLVDVRDARRARHQSRPAPVTMLTTPGGSPAASKCFASSRIVSGVCSAGLSTIVQPAQIAGASFHAAMSSG